MKKSEFGQIVIALPGLIIVIFGLVAAIAVMSTPTWKEAQIYVLEGDRLTRKSVMSDWKAGKADYVTEYTFSQHAMSGADKHGKYNAVSIAAMFSTGQCPFETCRSKRDPNLTIQYCYLPDNPNQIIAIVVNELGNIVTGYKSRANWWLNQCKGGG